LEALRNLTGSLLFSRRKWINKKHQKWIEESTDISKHRGYNINLMFSLLMNYPSFSLSFRFTSTAAGAILYEVG